MSTVAPDVFPLRLRVEPITRDDLETLRRVAPDLNKVDQTVKLKIDDECGEFWLHGQTELQLDTIIGELLETHGIGVRPGAPEIAYLEALSPDDSFEIEHSARDLRSDGRVTVSLHIEFDGDLSDIEVCFADAVGLLEDVRGLLAKKLHSVARRGLRIGFPFVRARVTLSRIVTEGAATPELIASVLSDAVRVVAEDVQILEPIMSVEVVCPARDIGSVSNDMNSRRGTVVRQETKGDVCVLEAHVPTAHLFGYLGQLNFLTKVTGRYAASFSHYAYMPMTLSGPENFPPAIGMRA